MQGRNLVPTGRVQRGEIHTHAVETKTDFHVPLDSAETGNQTDAPVTTKKVVQIEGVLHSSKHNATIRRQETKLEQSQQTLTQCRNEMVPVTEHQKIDKQLRAMSTTENETFVDLNREREKVKKVQGQLVGALEQIRNILSIYSDVLACRAPANNYALFVLEQYFLLKVR